MYLRGAETVNSVPCKSVFLSPFLATVCALAHLSEGLVVATSLLFTSFLINACATVEKRGSADLNEEIIRLRGIDEITSERLNLDTTYPRKRACSLTRLFAKGYRAMRLVRRYPPV